MTKELTKRQIEDRAAEIIVTAGDIEVVSESSREMAYEFCKGIKTAKQQVEDVLGKQVKAAHESWKIALTIKNQYMEPFEKAERTVKNKITAYELEQERIEEQRRQEALKQQQKQEAALHRALDKKIAAAEKKGNVDLAEELELEKNMTVVPIMEIEPVLSSIKGKASQKDYKVTVTDPNKLLQSVLKKEVQINLDKLVTIKVGAIKSFVKATGIVRIPGCIIEETKIQRIL